MTPEQKSELEKVIAEQHMLIKSEILAGNVVKEEFHRGTLFGIELTLSVLDLDNQ